MCHILPHYTFSLGHSFLLLQLLVWMEIRSSPHGEYQGVTPSRVLWVQRKDHSCPALKPCSSEKVPCAEGGSTPSSLIPFGMKGPQGADGKYLGDVPRDGSSRVLTSHGLCMSSKGTMGWLKSGPSQTLSLWENR